MELAGRRLTQAAASSSEVALLLLLLPSSPTACLLLLLSHRDAGVIVRPWLRLLSQRQGLSPERPLPSPSPSPSSSIPAADSVRSTCREGGKGGEAGRDYESDSSFLPSGDGEDVSSEAGGDQPSPLDSAGMLRKLVCRRICSCKLMALLLLLWAAGWRVVGSGTNACRRRSEKEEEG